MTLFRGLFNRKKSVLAASEPQVNDLEGSNLMTMTSFDTLSEAKNGLESHLQCEFSSLIRTKAAASFCCQNLHLKAWDSFFKLQNRSCYLPIGPNFHVATKFAKK